MTTDAPPTLNKLPDWCWNALLQGASDRGHAFRTGGLATVAHGHPEVRTVVLRRAEPRRRTLWFHTDRRSAKVAQLRDDPRVSWLFWDPLRRIQLRCRGRARLTTTEAECGAHWDSLHPGARREYEHATAPGEPLSTPGAIDESPESARNAFLPICCTVDQIDWLRLDRVGHQRALLEWTGGRWTINEVAP